MQGEKKSPQLRRGHHPHTSVTSDSSGSPQGDLIRGLLQSWADIVGNTPLTPLKLMWFDPLHNCSNMIPSAEGHTELSYFSLAPASGLTSLLALLLPCFTASFTKHPMGLPFILHSPVSPLWPN